MTLIGYTPGGSPIFFGARETRRPMRRCKNPRTKCQQCGHSTTRNQRKRNGNRCHQCKTEFKTE